AMEELLQRIAALTSTAPITDVGSTKRAALIAAEKAGLASRFVGAHPLAGDHRSGWNAARANLFRGATVFLCPSATSSPDAVAAVRSFWERLGGTCRIASAAEHDERMAWISHLPQVVASALANTLAAAEHPPADLGPGGRDTTRLAASSPALWGSICTTNA